MVEPIKELRAICYKDSKHKRPLYMELFTMKISIYITKLLLYTPIKADQVTISMMILSILGSVFMAFGSLKLMLIGIIIVHFTIILDNVNGEIARYRKEGNMTGTFLEFFYHEVTVTLVFFSLAYGIFSRTGWESVLIFGFLSSAFSKGIVLSTIKLAALKNVIRDDEKKRNEKAKKSIELIGAANLQGGSTKIGKALYLTYDKIREFWGHPINIVHVNLALLLEFVNYYYNFFPPYVIVYWYLVAYGTGSVIIQFISFIVHYKGKSVYHYYLALLGKGKKEIEND